MNPPRPSCPSHLPVLPEQPNGDAAATLSHTAPRLYGLIPAAGTGSRAGVAIPKQYQILAGQPLLWHTLSAFTACPMLAATLLVIAPEDGWFTPGHVPAGVSPLLVERCGGASRAGSVCNGLRALLQHHGARPHDWVLVHDAARCLITPADVQTLIAACQHDATGGLLALPLPDTLKSSATTSPVARVQATIGRTDKWLAQTPQMFRLEPLLHAIEQGLREAPDAITDEASAIERQGQQPLLVAGPAYNVKVTYPQDFALAEAVLQWRRQQAQV